MTQRVFIRKLLTADNFFLKLADNLDLMFPDGWIYPDLEEPCCAVDSTCGWADALEKTCVELDLRDCWEYWASLGWEESDILDGTIGDLLCAVAFDEHGYRMGDGAVKLGVKIKAAALLKNVSISKIAQAIDCTEDTTTKWLNGETYVTFQQLSDVADLLEVPLSVLLEGVNDERTLCDE